MGKDKKGKRFVSIDIEELRKLNLEEEDLKRRKRKFQAKCNHKNKKGHLKLDDVKNNENLYRCRRCGKIIDKRLITALRDDLKRSLEVIDTTIQVLKLNTSAEDDHKTIDALASLETNVQQILPMYEEVENRSNDHKGKKHRESVSFARGGSSLQYK